MVGGKFSVMNTSTQLGKGKRGPVWLERQVAVRELQEEVKASLVSYSEKLNTRVPTPGFQLYPVHGEGNR